MSDRFAAQDVAAVFGQFVNAINSHDVRALMSLMTEDHLFVDSVGNRMQDLTSMEAGWRGYFAMCPDYRIRADEVMTKDDAVLAVGEAGGTIDGVEWRTPAAWKAVLRDGRVVEWRVFADNQAVFEILARRQR
jgi:ketosteroid isomerase-like protein